MTFLEQCTNVANSAASEAAPYLNSGLAYVAENVNALGAASIPAIMGVINLISEEALKQGCDQVADSTGYDLCGAVQANPEQSAGLFVAGVTGVVGVVAAASVCSFFGGSKTKQTELSAKEKAANLAKAERYARNGNNDDGVVDLNATLAQEAATVGMKK